MDNNLMSNLGLSIAGMAFSLYFLIGGLLEFLNSFKTNEKSWELETQNNTCTNSCIDVHITSHLGL